MHSSSPRVDVSPHTSRVVARGGFSRAKLGAFALSLFSILAFGTNALIAHAALNVVIDNTSGAGSTIDATANQGEGVSQSFSTSTDTRIGAVEFWLAENTATTTAYSITANLVNADVNTSNGATNGGEILATSTISFAPNSTADQSVRFLFPNVLFPASSTWSVRVWLTSSTPANSIHFRRFSTDGYANGNGIQTTNYGGTTASTGNIGDYKFDVLAPDAFVQIDFPTSNTTSDFSNWTFTYQFATSTPHALLKINYASSTNPFAGKVDQFQINGNATTTQISKAKGSALNLAVWYGEAELVIDHGFDTFEVVATSSVINWAIGGYPSFNSTSTIGTSVSCDFGGGNFITNPLGTIEQGVCVAGTFLFVPSEDVLTRFNDVKEAIITKPPLGYIGAVSTLLSDINASSTPTVGFSAIIVGLVGTSIFDTISTYVSYMIWLAVAFWFYHRFRNFNFTNP